jgi:GTP-binding protein YchF
LELIFSDLEVLERRMEKSIKLSHSGDKKAIFELGVMEQIKAQLEAGKPARTIDFNEDESAFVKDLFLITSKPVLYAANISEDDLISGNGDNELVKGVKEFAIAEHSEVITVCASLEEQLATLSEEEQSEMLGEYGLAESGLNKLVHSSYKLLGLMSFLTAGADEVRAWTIKNGTKAQKAAGKIHSDIERGFIRAEIVSFDDLVKCGSEVNAKEKGLYRLEGKEYVMQDGDIVNFRFNV